MNTDKELTDKEAENLKKEVKELKKRIEELEKHKEQSERMGIYLTPPHNEYNFPWRGPDIDC